MDIHWSNLGVPGVFLSSSIQIFIRGDGDVTHLLSSLLQKNVIWYRNGEELLNCYLQLQDLCAKLLAVLTVLTGSNPCCHPLKCSCCVT